MPYSYYCFIQNSICAKVIYTKYKATSINTPTIFIENLTKITQEFETARNYLLVSME